jgi:glycosyltransferase involved in cell wall biosynthesis
VKVVYVTMQFPVPSEAFAAVEIRALRRQGADLHVLCYRPAPAKAAEMLRDRDLADLPLDHGSAAGTLRGLAAMLRRPGDTAFLLGYLFRHGLRRPKQLLKALALVPRSFDLLRRIEVLRPHVVHLYWGHFPSLLGLLVRRRLPEVLVSQFLGAYDLEEAFPLSGVLARDADYLVTLSRANVPAIAALGAPAEKVQVSFHGVDIPRPLPSGTKTPGLMVVAERLVPQKCTADAIRVFAAVHRDLPEARLVVCGMGPEAAHLKQLADDLGLGEAVRFAGHVAHSELLALFDRAEVTLTMSRSPSERLPNVMKEAMLRRCLCLSSRTAGIEELIDDGDSGLIVDLSDVAGAARRLGAILGDAGQVAAFGRRAQEKIVAEFDVDRLMAERLSIWSALRDGRKRNTAA